MLQSDADNVQTVVSNLEKENSLLRQAQLLNQLFIEETDPILVAANDKVKFSEFIYLLDLLIQGTASPSFTVVSKQDMTYCRQKQNFEKLTN